jgi:hypothetical protein
MRSQEKGRLVKLRILAMVIREWFILRMTRGGSSIETDRVCERFGIARLASEAAIWH